MELHDKVIVITGGGSGIGAAMARRFARELPSALVLADLNLEGAASVADEGSNQELIEGTEERFGPIDLFCANAGIGTIGDEQAELQLWDRMWRVNTMSHIHAAKHLVPGWVARGDGYFLATVSAAGLLTNLKAAQYSVTKHATLAFAEWIAVTYGDAGVKVSALCPQFVNTPLIEGSKSFQALGRNNTLEASDVAETVVDGLRDERFLILPHPEVGQYFQNKANDYDRWINGMRKLQRTVFPSE